MDNKTNNPSKDKLNSTEAERRNQLKKTKPRVFEKVLKFEEKFKKGESIAIIQLHYNYMCNFSCEHCSISSLRNKKNGKALTIDNIKEISRQADEMGLAHIDVTGGEPLIFPDLDQLIAAIDPAKFYIQVDTNGWLMTDEKAKHLKSIGVDKIQLSLDSLVTKEHDEFRRKPDSHRKAVDAIDSIQKAGLNLILSTVVTHQRLRSEEFVEFLEFAKKKNAPVSVSWTKPVGEWANKTDSLITNEDTAYLNELRTKYNVFEHRTPAYGLNIGCLAVKRMIAITQFGDVLPCPWMYFSLGNVLNTPLKDIVEKGMKYFSQHEGQCLVSCDKCFVEKYVAKTNGKEVPVPIEEIMPEDWRNS